MSTAKNKKTTATEEEGLVTEVPEDNAEMYSEIGVGDILAYDPQGNPITPIPTPDPDSDVIGNSQVLESQGIIEVRDSQTGMMMQMTGQQVDAQMKQLEQLKKATQK